MKNIRFYNTINGGLSHFRIAAVGLLLLGAAALAAVAVSPNPPKLPWRVPTVNVGIEPATSVVDQATHTVYVANVAEDTVSVIDGNRCNSSNASRCSPIATLTVGPNPLFMAFDLTTGTLYTTLLGGTENTIAVVNANTCNARNTSGCGQTPAVVTVPGATFTDDFVEASNIVLDTATHTLYIGDANVGPVSFLDTATCNGTNTSGCSETPTTTATNGDYLTIDHTNHSVYVTSLIDATLSVFDSATCNAGNTSGCGQAAGPFPNSTLGLPGTVDETTHTIYVGATFNDGALDYVAMIDGSRCNSTVTSGCGDTPAMVQVGSFPTQTAMDPTTRTVYVVNQESSTISVINADTCNATTQAGCTPLQRAHRRTNAHCKSEAMNT
jgi:YVTN family beta-propeller protein